MHVSSRSVVAAARTHPAGVAAPSAVIVPSMRLGLFGAGSAPAIPPSPDQPQPRNQPQPVPTGPPVLPRLAGSVAWNASRPSGWAEP